MTSKRRRKKSLTIYRMQKGASSAAYNFLNAFGIFSAIFFVSAFFIFFQWKSVSIRNKLQSIDKLTQQILQLNAENTRLETVRNNLLKTVPARAQKELSMIIPVKNPQKIYVKNKTIMDYDEEN